MLAYSFHLRGINKKELIAIDNIFGQVLGQEVKNQKTLLNFLVLTGKHKDQVVNLEGASDLAIGTRCLMAGKFNSKKRFKVNPINTEAFSVQDDLQVIAEMTGVFIPEEEYLSYLKALQTNNLYTAADILSDSDMRDVFLSEYPDSGEFIGLANYVSTEKDASGLAQIFIDAGTSLGFSHALQIAYAMKNRQGYLKTNLLAMIAQCPWIISQVIDGEDVDDAIKKLEKYFKISQETAAVYRAANIMVMVIKECMRFGDCFVTQNILRARAYRKGVTKDQYDSAWELLVGGKESRKIFAGIVPDGNFTIEAVTEAKRFISPKTKWAVYLPGIFFSEKEAADLYYLNSQTPAKPLSFKSLKKHLKAVENNFGKELNTDQMKLIKSVCENKITILTGEAGTGKSQAIKILAEAYFSLKESKPIIIAPTALAAFRAADGTSMAEESKTIHRYASIMSDDSDLFIYKPDFDAAYIDSPGLVIVDECSMLGPVMLRKLLKKITPDTRLVFTGDPNQLPPIGADGIFTAMLKLTKEGIGNHVHLVENYRNSEGVIEAARALIHNEPLPEVEGVYVHVCAEGDIPDKIRECVELVGGINITDTMVLSPYRAHGFHTEAINKILARKYGSNQVIPGTSFQIGDPVLARKNDYMKGGIPRPSTIKKLRTARGNVYNGMKGIIQSYDPATHTVTIDYFTGIQEKRIYRVEELPYYIEQSYATTVHKAQGGQAKNIILVLDSAMKNLHLIYTALTRCQEGGQVHIITKAEFLKAPYLKEVEDDENTEFEYSSNRCLNKFKYRVLIAKGKPKKRAYGAV